MELLENLKQFLKSIKTKMNALINLCIFSTTLFILISVKSAEESIEIISYNTTSTNSEEINEHEVK